MENLLKRTDLIAKAATTPTARKATPNDPFYDDQPHMRAVGMEEAWAVSAGDPNIVIAIIDSGVDVNHPEMRRVWSPCARSCAHKAHMLLYVFAYVRVRITAMLGLTPVKSAATALMMTATDTWMIAGAIGEVSPQQLAHQPAHARTHARTCSLSTRFHAHWHVHAHTPTHAQTQAHALTCTRARAHGLTPT
eukprot:2981424-Pleurochrysis_carterae.AAC.1